MLNAMYAIVGFLCTFIADTLQNHFSKSSLVSLKMESNLSPLKGPLVAIVGSPSGLVEKLYHNDLSILCGIQPVCTNYENIQKWTRTSSKIVLKEKLLLVQHILSWTSGASI